MAKMKLDNILNNPEHIWRILLVIVVIVANIQIYWLQILVEDDYFYGITWWRLYPDTFIQNILVHGAGLPSRPNISWFLNNLDVFLARTLVLIGILVPCSILIFNILRKLSYPIPVAFFAASLIWFFPGQKEIPFFVTASYVAEGLLIMSVSFRSAIKYLEDNEKNNWIWFAFTLTTLLWSLKVNEQVAAGAFAICFCLLCWKRFEKKVCILTGAMALIVIYHTYFNILHGGRLINRAEPLSFEKFKYVAQSFLKFYSPLAGLEVGIIDITLTVCWSLVLLAVIVLIKKITVAISSDNNFIKMPDKVTNVYEYIWHLLFPIGMFLAPLLIMVVAPYFTPRHAIFSALGFYLFVSYTLYELFKKNQKTVTVLLAVFALATMIKHYSHVYNSYVASNNDHKIVSEFIKNKKFPSKAQIAVLGVDVRTDGYFSFSTGYFINLLNRKDVTGIIGEDFNLNDPFKKANKIRFSKMNSLNLSEPLFLYRKTEAGIEQLTYLLQWKQNIINSDFAIYQVDKYSGKLALHDVGQGWESYLEKRKAIVAKEGKLTDIMWGGELTASDKKRVGIQ